MNDFWDDITRGEYIIIGLCIYFIFSALNVAETSIMAVTENIYLAMGLFGVVFVSSEVVSLMKLPKLKLIEFVFYNMILIMASIGLVYLIFGVVYDFKAWIMFPIDLIHLFMEGVVKLVNYFINNLGFLGLAFLAVILKIFVWNRYNKIRGGVVE